MYCVQIRMRESYMKGIKILLRYVVLTRELACLLLYNSRGIKRISKIMTQVIYNLCTSASLI